MAKQISQKVITKKHQARLERERKQRRTILITTAVVVGLVVIFLGLGIADYTIRENMGTSVYTHLFEGQQPVATVGNVAVTTREFQNGVRLVRFNLINEFNYIASDPLMSQYFGQYLQQIASELVDQTSLPSDTLDGLIEDKLVEMEAKKRGISVSNDEIDRYMQSQFNYFPKGTATPTATLASLPTSTYSPTQLALIATSTPTITPTPTVSLTPTDQAPTMTVTPTATPKPETTPTPGPTDTPAPTPTEYTQKAYQAEADKYLAEIGKLGISLSDFKRVLKARLLKEKLQNAMSADIQNPQEQVWARHILVDKEDLANTIYNRISAGENFADLAKEFSKDSSSSSGGDLDWFTRGVMVKEFEDTAFALKVGEVSKPVKSEFGYHLIQVLGHEVRSLDSTQFSNLRNNIYKKWLDNMKKEQTVVKNDIWMKRIPTKPETPTEALQVLQQSGQ
ncbi:MAG TPA: peptidylprolyl isomerase [Anaerolineaceae bacterium]